MRRVTWTDQENQMEGWFHELSTEGNEDGIYPVAVVEMDDGALVTVGIGSHSAIRFVPPYQPQAQAAGGPFDNAQDYGAKLEPVDHECADGLLAKDRRHHICDVCEYNAACNVRVDEIPF